MDLPKDFITRMQQLLQEDANDFFQSYQQPKAYGLRFNPLKYGNDFSKKVLPFTLTPVAWAREGFYAVAEEHPGKHPLHEGGAYYIQEPSAMSVVSLLAPEPGDIVCDLCAAPGGKSTQIAGRLMGEGLLISNEIFPARAKILSQNIERFGAANCVVCNEPPDNMAAHFPLFFNKIVVDAPCSGEGMFRKDDTAIEEWSLQQVAVCKERQEMILEYADRMLAPGGVMVYSTCTFSPDEDENMIAWFLSTHPDYILEDWREILPQNCGLEGGRTAFLEENSSGKDTGAEDTNADLFEKNAPFHSGEIEKTLRLWPHKLKGEGHFAARLRKTGTLLPHDTGAKSQKKKRADIADYLDFAKQFLRETPDKNAEKEKDASFSVTSFLRKNNSFQYFGDELYLVPSQMNSLKGLKVMRAGLHLGTRKKNRFEPAHALAMALSPKDVIQYQNCDYDTALHYLRGETISCDANFRSWTLVCCDGISLGWGKAQNSILKNHYPKGLRIQNK